MSRQEFYGDNRNKKAIKTSDRKINSVKIQTKRTHFQNSKSPNNLSSEYNTSQPSDDECIVRIAYFELTEAKPICYGTWWNNNTMGYEQDKVFVWQKANIKLLPPPCTGIPCPYDPTDFLYDGMYLVAGVWRRNIQDNTLIYSEWEHLGNVQAFRLDLNDNIISPTLDIDVDMTIAFGPYFPSRGQDIWDRISYKGIPCRRPYEEILISLCMNNGSLWGYAIGENGLPVTLGPVPCAEEKIDIYKPIEWDEQNNFNVREDYSSREMNNVEYGEPHTWYSGDSYELRPRKPSYLAHHANEFPDHMNPMPGNPAWDCTLNEHDHPNNRCAGNCDGYSAWYYGMYRFGPYATKKDYENPYGLGCPSGHRNCCIEPIIGMDYNIRTIGNNNKHDVMILQSFKNDSTHSVNDGSCCIDATGICENITSWECEEKCGTFYPNKVCSEDNPCGYSTYKPKDISHKYRTSNVVILDPKNKKPNIKRIDLTTHHHFNNSTPLPQGIADPDPITTCMEHDPPGSGCDGQGGGGGGNCKCVFKKKENLEEGDDPINPCWNDEPLGPLPEILPNQNSSDTLCFEIKQSDEDKRKCKCDELAGKIPGDLNDPNSLDQNQIRKCKECKTILESPDSDPNDIKYCQCLEKLMQQLQTIPSKEDVHCCSRRLKNSDYFYPCCCPHPEYPGGVVDPDWTTDNKWNKYRCQYGIRCCQCQELECKMKCANDSGLTACLAKAFKKCLDNENMPHDIPHACPKERTKNNKCKNKCKRIKNQCNKDVAACQDVKHGGFDLPSL